MANPLGELVAGHRPFPTFLEALTKRQPTAVSVTLLVEDNPSLFGQKRSINLAWSTPDTSGNPEVYTETIHTWRDYEEAAYDDALPYGAIPRTILTVNEKVLQLKETLPAVALQVIAGNGEGGMLTAIEFQQKVQLAQEQGFEPYPVA